jgi:UDP-N-acetyl-D-mannosaminuronic acid dehydrogenase
MPIPYVPEADFDVAVIGLGYVGLPTALILAGSGLRTAGVDINESQIAKLQNGTCTLNEEEVIELFNREGTRRNFSAFTTPPKAAAYIIAVPTPLDHRRKVADLSALKAATNSLLPVLQRGALVIVESTTPPLTCREIVKPILELSGLRVGEDIYLSHCPERLFPGNTIHELVHNSRIIGGACAEATRRTLELYKTFAQGECLVTDDVTAEFCKLIENTYRDVNIALSNELAGVADKLGISIVTAIDFANRHPRVNLLKPGIGVGGHCIPIDPWFIAEVADTALIPTARRVNDARPAAIAGRIRRAVAHIVDPVIGFYGVTYKPNVNDQRESPAWEIIRQIREDGYRTDVQDPIAGIDANRDIFAFASGKDALVVLVEHTPILPVLQDRRDELLLRLNHPVLLTF